MMITYEKGYRFNAAGNGWALYSDDKKNETLIVHQLRQFVLTNQMLTFDELYKGLKKQYRNKTVRSNCSIDICGERIEVTVRGVFPRFYITKTNQNA